MEKMIERFTRYVKIDTQSDPFSKTIPSTMKQKDLGNVLKEELKHLGIDSFEDQYGFISACLPSNTNKKCDKIGFLAHMDTAPDYSGTHVQPQLIRNYQGQAIAFADGDCLTPERFDSLLSYVGKTLITTDGTTLLGGDDKAGIAIIMEALSYLTSHPEVEHGDIYVAFTIDEEIGTGVDHFNSDHFKADYAYTVDGGPLGGFEFETFNGAKCTVNIQGVSVHPGTAKGAMVHAHEVAFELHQMLPQLDKPEHTEGREGFYMVASCETSIDHATIRYIIRDHDYSVFEYRKHYLEQAIIRLQAKYPTATIAYEMSDQYYNMKEKVEAIPRAIEYALEAMKRVGIQSSVSPVRGGTDGSKLSFMGIPCPNIFTGTHNAHGKYEYVCVESMIAAKQTVLEIIKQVVEEAK